MDNILNDNKLLHDFCGFLPEETIEIFKKDVGNYHKNLFMNSNLSMLIIDGETGDIIDANIAAHNFYGYTYEKIKKLNISHIDILPKEEVLKKFNKSPASHFQKYILKHRLANRELRDVEVVISPLKTLDKNYIYTVIKDITENKAKEKKFFTTLKIMEDVLKGITDIIGVYKPDHTVLFYNEAGYRFYNKTPNEIKGKKCYEMLNRSERCLECTTEAAVKSKKIVRIEKYIPELNKYMECCCNPILDDLGEVLYVVEQLRDITEKKATENILRESENKYRSIVDVSPDAIIIIVDEKIVFVNNEASKLYGLSSEHLLGQSLEKFIHPAYIKTLKKRIKQIFDFKINKALFDYKVIRHDNSIIDVEISSTYLIYQGKPAIQAVIRDITYRKESLVKAASLQKQTLQTLFPLSQKAKMDTIYIPCKTVSGDFFHFHRVSDNLVIGIIADVSGKGITAALNLSAFNVLFHDIVLSTTDPLAITNILNKKIASYMDETFIATCCFSLDFKNNKARVVGSGINQFLFKRQNNENSLEIVKGPFLGMFKDSYFDEKTINFNPGDTFYFFTDGLDFIFENDDLKEKYIINYKQNDLNDYLNDMLTDVDGIKDDCTLITLRIK